MNVARADQLQTEGNILRSPQPCELGYRRNSCTAQHGAASREPVHKLAHVNMQDSRWGGEEVEAERRSGGVAEREVRGLGVAHIFPVRSMYS